jgi:hypothetical protein
MRLRTLDCDQSGLDWVAPAVLVELAIFHDQISVCARKYSTVIVRPTNMNLPIEIPEGKRAEFHQIVTKFQNDLMKFEELSQAWLEGFCNYILHSHTDHDDNNNYLPEEEPSYTSYKEGAKAAMAFIKCSQKAEPRS